jgi:PAS domain S-box-containing protein
MTGVAALSGYYDFRLVALSVLIAVLSAYAALDLGGRVTTARGWVRPAWLWCGAIAMGFGIWTMHFVGMLAFRLPVRVMYDWPIVLVSLVMAILTSGVALLAVSQPRLSPTRLTIGAIFMGGGIAAMHYVGMEAMRLPAMCRYSPWLVGLSVLLAVAISFAAIKLTFSFRESTAAWSVSKTLIAVLLGLAILVMHYVGMAAARFLPLAGMNGSLAHAVQVSALGLTCVALSAGVALGLVFLTSIVDRHFWLQAEQLAKSQSQLQTIFDNMTEGIVVVGSKQDAVLVNPAAVRLLGLPKGKYEFARIVEEVEVLSMDGTVLPPEQWPTARALGGEFAQNRETLVRRKSTGETSVLEVSTAPVRTGSGELEQVVITYRDIAARRQMDEAQQRLARQLAESQMQLQAIFDTMTEGIYVLDRNGDTVVANAAAIRLLAVPGDKSAFRNFIEQNEILSPDGVPLAYEELPAVRALRGEFVQNFEVLCRQRSTGKLDAREISTAPVGNGFEESGQVVVTFRDATERKQMDEMRNRLAAIVESSEDGIVSIDKNGVVTSWNKGAEKVFGYTASEMVGNSVLRLLPEDRQQEEAEFIRRIQIGETIQQVETVRQGKNGKAIQVSLTVSPICGVDGKVVGASKIVRDITERKQLQNQLYQSQKMEAIGQLTGGIAHDFNNLLGVILGNLDLLEMRIEDDESALKRVRTAQTAATRGADLIKRLLATSSNVEWTAAPTRLQNSVRNMMDLAQTLGPDIKIVLHVDDEMPSVLVDAAGLESALLNLAVNARDAMPMGGTLTMSAQLSVLEENYPPVKAGELKAGCYACVSVSDTGEGMSKETLARVFEPFFTTKPRGKGTGLGLAMVYGFAKQSGGTVRIYSELGCGTTVSLYLPLAKEIAETATPVGGSPTAERLSGTALVVDDEAELVEIAKAYLEEMGYTVYHAEDAARALALVEKHREIDLLVTDILMPGMNGAELAKKIRESLNEVKIIYCSGFPANALAERALSLADGPLLHKPYLRTTFGSVVRAVMDRNGRGRGSADSAARLDEAAPVSGELASVGPGGGDR